MSGEKVALGIGLVGLTALLVYAGTKGAEAGGGVGQKPAYWDSTYPAWPPSWWLSSKNGKYVLMYHPSQGETWVFPQDVAAYKAGGWLIVP